MTAGRRGGPAGGSPGGPAGGNAGGAAGGGANDGEGCAALELLAVCGVTDVFGELSEAIVQYGGCLDLAQDVAGARRAFLRRGGHRWLVLAGDVCPAVAQAVVASLRALDPQLGIVVFGADLLRQQDGVRRLAAYHPGSRAGVGALLRLVRAEQ